MFYVAIIIMVVLCVITYNYSKGELNTEKSKIYTILNLIGIVFLVFCVVNQTINLWRFLPHMVGQLVAQQLIRLLIMYGVSALLIVINVKLLRKILEKNYDSDSVKSKEDTKAVVKKNGRYYTSFKALMVIYTLLSAAVSFVIIGFIEQWDFTFGMIISRLIGSAIGAIIYTYLYFLPYMIAVKKEHSQKRAIYILNIFTSWTIIVWIISLVWANTEPKQTVVINQIKEESITPTERLEELKKLKDNQIITAEEFERKRAEIISEL